MPHRSSGGAGRPVILNIAIGLRYGGIAQCIRFASVNHRGATVFATQRDAVRARRRRDFTAP
jgi:hypothetical protein